MTLSIRLHAMSVVRWGRAMKRWESMHQNQGLEHAQYLTKSGGEIIFAASTARTLSVLCWDMIFHSGMRHQSRPGTEHARATHDSNHGIPSTTCCQNSVMTGLDRLPG